MAEHIAELLLPYQLYVQNKIGMILHPWACDWKDSDERESSTGRAHGEKLLREHLTCVDTSARLRY